MSDLQITIQQGALKGTTGTDLNGRTYYSFYGIPYAKPPLGALRFKAPQPPEKWSGVRDATTDAGACYSRDFLVASIIAGSEDCLVLNVYTPELPKTNTVLKPVMVWIHGGGFVTGSNDSNMYGPQFLITEDVVIVAINYRLGALGFLVMDDPEVGVPGNAGLKDMVMALKWIQANIKHFGGDPNNVTIFGESAGGAAAHYLVLSPMAKGLFHRAIAQSGCVVNPWAMARPSGKELAQALNCPYTKEADVLTYLQSLTVEEILKGQDALNDLFKVNYVRPVGPVIEKVTPYEPSFLSENPVDIMLNGNYNNVPIIMGYTNAEGLLFNYFEPEKPPSEDFEDFIIPSFKLERGSDLSKAVANKIKHFYYGNEVPSVDNKIKEYTIQTDTYFIYGIQQCIKYHVLTSDKPLYLYRLTIEGNLNFLKVYSKMQLPGTAHGDDLGYLFKTLTTPDNIDLDSIEVKTVRRIVKLWTNFAKTGNPNPVENVKWEPVTQEGLNCLDIGENLVLIVNPEEERMEFWNNVLK